MSDKKSNVGKYILYGCATMMVMAVICIVILIFGARWGYKKFVASYTSPTAMQLPAVTYTDAEVQSLTNRLEAFKATASALTNDASLTLSARDINVLIHSQEDLKHLRDRFHIEVDKDKVKATVSIPLDDVGLDSLRGRFLTGEAGLKVEITNGQLFVYLDSLKVNGAAVSQSFITQMKNENFAKELAKDPEVEKILRQVEKLTIENGEVILKLKESSPAAEPGAPATTNGVPADAI